MHVWVLVVDGLPVRACCCNDVVVCDVLCLLLAFWGLWFCAVSARAVVGL